MKFLEKEANGITLIALVVTIVVLIILATVSINLVLGDNGIISQAQEAKEVTRGASAKEEIDIWKINIEADKLTNSTIAESKEDLLDRLVENGTLTQEEADKLANKETITIGKSEISLDETAGGGTGDEGVNSDDTIDLSTLQIGDYVNYTYDEAANYTDLTGTGSTKNPEDGIAQNATTLRWRILNINKENSTIDLVSAIPTDNTIYFQDTLGYNNGVYLLNNICAKLYSNNGLGIIARSINLADIENHLTAIGISNRNNYKSTTNTLYGSTYKYTSYLYYPNIYHLGQGIDLSDDETITQPDLNGVDPYNESSNYYSVPTTEKYTKANSSITITQTYYDLYLSSGILGEAADVITCLSNGYYNYWVASRYLDTSSSTNAEYGLRYVMSGYNATRLVGTIVGVGGAGGHEPLRPVVTLNVSLLDGTKDADGAWNLKTNVE